MVGLSRVRDLFSVAGIRLASAQAGFYAQKRDDVLLIDIDSGATSSVVFTRNQFAAAPVTVARSHVKSYPPRFCLINAGNANAGTGEAGILDALSCCRHVSIHGSCAVEEVMPFSTGVIGERLPVERIHTVIPACIQGLSADGWIDGARAIMTTDTVEKWISEQFYINGSRITITGIAKGSGMIRPDMATMLAFIATDVEIGKGLLDKTLRHAVEKSFNRITVDGDTSTNDACMLIATNKSSTKITEEDTTACEIFRQAVSRVCQTLAQAIVRDGEGASKFVTVQVEKGKSSDECLQVAYCIAHSLLVKTALFASDPNWGRILAAVGRAGIEELDISCVQIYLNSVCVVNNGCIAADYKEDQGYAAMHENNITIRVVLNRGNINEHVWTTDLSCDYVNINASYRS